MADLLRDTLYPNINPHLEIYIFLNLLNTYACTWPIYFPAGSDSKASVHNAGDPGSSPGLGRSLEKEMAIYSSTTAWKIPWTEETGRLQSMGSQRVGHD